MLRASPFFLSNVAASRRRGRLERRVDGGADDVVRRDRRRRIARQVALAATAGSEVAAPVVGLVDRVEQLFVIAAVRHTGVKVARPLPAQFNVVVFFQYQ